MISRVCALRAISSHLQTCGCSMVVGSNPDKVNKVNGGPCGQGADCCITCIFFLHLINFSYHKQHVAQRNVLA
jgi:hypothetical protein